DGEDKICALNTIGLRRAGFGDDDIVALKDAVRKLWFGRKKNFAGAMAEFDLMNGINPRVRDMVEFLQRRDKGKHGRYPESLRTGGCRDSRDATRRASSRLLPRNDRQRENLPVPR